MKKLFDIYVKVLSVITKVVGVIAGALLFVPAFMIFYEVLARGIFNAPTEWVMEISTYCVVMAGFLGMGVAYYYGSHIKVDLLISHLSPKTRCIFELLMSFIGLFFIYIFMTEATDMVITSLENNNCAPTTLSTPLWIPQSSMPIGLGVLFCQILKTILVDIEKIITGNYVKEAI